MASPPTLPAGCLDMRDYYPDQDPPRPTPHTAPSITPYLGLRARLSQVWINRWTVLLLLVLVRTLLAISGINDDLASARREALSACSSVEAMGSAMASMPHYMAQGVNDMAAGGVEKAVNGLMDMATLSVTGVEEMVVFFIDLMTSTYLCLITLAVGGSLHVALQFVEDAQQSLNSSIKAIGKDMSNTVGTFESEYNSFISKLSSGLTGLLGSSVKPPSLDLNATLAALDKIQLPRNLDKELTKLNNSIPTFAQVQNFTNNAIRFPFEEIKTLIDQYIGNYTFDRSVFPVPVKEQLSFCSDNNGINDFFDHLVALVATARKVFIGVLLVAAVLACIPMSWREIRRWRTMQERSRLVHASAHDPMDVVYIVSRPYTSTAGIKVASRFSSTRRQILTRWVVAYATSTAALFLLSLALAGLLSCVCQIILLKSLEKEVPALTNQVGAFADTVINSLNNASEQWAIGTNRALEATNNDINHQMLGWVNISTGALNNTLNTFVNDTIGVLNTTFGGTVLYKPILGVLDCLVLLKVRGIENALTWISDHAKVSLPTLANDTFSLGAVASLASSNPDPSDSFLSAPGDEATDKISASVARFIAQVENAIRTEAILSTCLLLVYVLIVLLGIGRALTLWFGRDKPRGEGGVETVQAARDGFVDVPMDTFHPPDSQGPAPKYSAEPNIAGYESPPEGGRRVEKYGFADQR